MALFKIRFLNEEQLLKAIKDSGREDVANILVNRGLNGQSFLEFQEIQTIGWKLPRVQIRNLMSYINEVKANPTILIKGGGLVQHQLHKPKPNLPSTHKPSLPSTQKPSLPSTQKPTLPSIQKQNLQSIPQRPASLKLKIAAAETDNIGSGLLESEIKAPNKSFDIKNPTEQYEFKKKLGAKLSSPDTSPGFISTGANSKSSKTLTLQPNSVNDPMPKPPRLLIKQSMQTSDVKTKEFKPLTAEVHGARPKVIKYTPSESNIQTSKHVKERPVLPLPRESESDIQSPEEEEYSDIDPKIDYGYMTPSDVENRYPIAAANIISTQKVNHNKTNFLHSKFAKTIPGPTTNSDDEELEDTYEAAPTLHSPQPTFSKYPLSLPTKEENSKISQMANRRPMPLPIAPTEPSQNIPYFSRPTDSSGNQNYSPNNSNKHEDPDEEMNIYDHVDENQKDGDNRTDPHSVRTEKEFHINNQQFGTPQQKRKCTLGELENIIIVDNEKDMQFKRTSTFFGTLGSLGKFFGTKNKSGKMETENPSNYENHMLLSEKKAIESPRSFKDRPLPEIPKVENTSSIKKSSSSSSSKLSMNDMEIKNDTRKGTIEHRRRNEFSKNSNNNRSLPEITNRPLPEISNTTLLEIIDHDDQELVYDNVQDNSHDEEESDLPEYENNETLNNSAKAQSSTNSLLTGDLALKLSEELKKREKKLKDKNAVENSVSKMSSRNREGEKLNKISTPPLLETDDEPPLYGNIDNFTEPNDDNLPTYGNIEEIDQIDAFDKIEASDHSDEEEQEYIDSIFNINQEPFYRETDRKGAKQLLRNLDDGAFLFRPSEKYFLVLTIKFSKKFYNLGIERTTTNKIRLNADMSSVSPEFGTLKAFVNYFTNEALTFRDRENVLEIYLNPVLPADVF